MHRIDVHHHILPPAYVSMVGEERIAAPSSSGLLPRWSIEHALDVMDRAGIATAITSISSPGFSTADNAAGEHWRTHLVRGCNEYAARMAHDHRDRFGLFASLPLPDLDASLDEVAYSLDVLGANGICLLTNHEGRYLGDPFFEPLLAELDRRCTIVFVHPASPACAACLPGVSASTLEFPFDTTRTITSLVLAGVTLRYPRIQFIFSHAGGTLPFLAGRLESLTRNNPALREQTPQGVIAEFRKLWFDTALAANRWAFGSLLELTTPDRILFGTDFPFASDARVQSAVSDLAHLGLDAGALAAVESGNALRLLGRGH